MAENVIVFSRLSPRRAAERRQGHAAFARSHYHSTTASLSGSSSPALWVYFKLGACWAIEIAATTAKPNLRGLHRETEMRPL